MDEMPGMSFGHAGTIVEGKEDTASEKIARLAQAGITVAERIEDIPEMIRAKIQDRREERSVRKDGIFIAVEVDDGSRLRRRDRAKLTEACPVDIFAGKDGRSRSSRRTSTSACSAGCAWTPSPDGVTVHQALRGWRRALV